jgi:leucyl aminopeptidase (aminopeptidase T)
MTLRSTGLMSVCSVAVLALLGCKDDEQCARARNAASQAWKTVSESAGKNQLAPTIGLEELPDDKKQPHVEAWGTIGKQSEMVSASFMYERITWNTADPAVQKANQAFDGYFAKPQFKTFETQLRDANDKYKAAGAACRE